MGPLDENKVYLLLVSVPWTGLLFPQACASQESSCEPVRAEGSSVFLYPVSAVLGGMAHNVMHSLVELGETTGRKIK